VQLAISRKREYTADATGVKFTRSPTGLINALKKIKLEHPTREDRQITKAIAPLFISNPFKKFGGLFQTHPPLEKRIEILERM
ncbi:MAG: M48 family metalloprotease, partial [Nanoarchaeota archaeon]